jgi:16S rRNA (guanine527-N7)-methyltransferase
MPEKSRTLADHAASMGVSFNASSYNKVSEYCKLLLTWNSRINLTGARTQAELEDIHIVDSLALLKLIPRRGSLVDVGSGAGLPALPAAIIAQENDPEEHSEVPVTLVESSAKRVAFLRTAVRTFSLSRVDVYRGRMEDLTHRAYDVACSRATWPALEWLVKGFQLVRPGGLVVVFATRQPALEDLEKSGHAKVNARVVDEVEYNLSGGRRRWAGVYCST